jgi:hypothetical protein
MAGPALWLGDRLVAAPLAGFQAMTHSAIPLQPWIGRKITALSH